MYTQEELASKNLPELQQIAKDLEISKIRTYKKEGLFKVVLERLGLEYEKVPESESETETSVPQTEISVEEETAFTQNLVRPKRTRIKKEVYSTSENLVSNGEAKGEIMVEKAPEPDFKKDFPMIPSSEFSKPKPA